MGYNAKLTVKGQMTVPQEVRESLNLKSGDRVEFVLVEGGAMMIPKNRRLADLAGILGTPSHGAGATLKDIDEAVGQYLAEDDERISREWRERHK